jgi:predicted nucleic acid-binding protein
LRRKSKKRAKTHVRINDLWLGAQAIQRGFRLLTSNARDFADIPGLQMVVLKVP